MTNTISNSDDVIDSRDVIERIEELRGEFETACELPDVPEDFPVQPLDDADTAGAMTCGECGRSWDDTKATDWTPAPSARCPFEYFHAPTADALIAAAFADESHDMHAEAVELRALESLAEEAEGYAGDWQHGETLIRDSYFQTYAQELADDIGAIPKDAAWPCNCIDWEEAARQLQQDYTSVDFDGVTYWVR